MDAETFQEQPSARAEQPAGHAAVAFVGPRPVVGQVANLSCLGRGQVSNLSYMG